MIIGFNPQFVDPILKGTKIHTIRADVHNRWKQGRTLHMSTGVRTPNFNCFHEQKCLGIQHIEIDLTGLIAVTVEGRSLNFGTINQLAINDGFTNVIDFRAWFARTLENAIYTGKIIHWTNYRY